MDQHKLTDEHPENIYAKDVEGKTVFINEVESGRKGYYCLGCDKEMQAVKFTIKGYKSYFRHDYETSKHQGQCIYNSETYRHKLGKEALFLSKKIKVPKILKYHPSEKNFPAIVLREDIVINAHRVEIEMPFFENEAGEVVYGRGLLFEEKNLLIQPDVAFFNKDDEPILLIELVATHKVDNEKIAKVRRLGIDMVQIILPKDSPQSIAECFNSIANTKWIFNNEEARADYLQLSESNPETISYPDAEQRKLFGETFACRQAEIRLLISGIRKCLLSEQYLRSTEFIDAEIARVEGFAENEKTQLLEYERSCREGRREPIELEERRIISETATNDVLFNRVRSRRKELGQRYNAKKSELDAKVSEIERQTGALLDDESQFDENPRGEIERIGELIREEETVVSGTVAEIENLESVFRARLTTEGAEIDQKFVNSERNINELEIRIRNRSDEFSSRLSKQREEFESKERDLEFRRDEDKRGLEEEFERKYCDIQQAIKSRDFERDSEDFAQLRSVISGGKFLESILHSQKPLERIRTALESIKDGTYKAILERYN